MGTEPIYAKVSIPALDIEQILAKPIYWGSPIIINVIIT